MACITIVDLHGPKHVSDHTLDLILALRDVKWFGYEENVLSFCCGHLTSWFKLVCLPWLMWGRSDLNGLSQMPHDSTWFAEGAGPQILSRQICHEFGEQQTQEAGQVLYKIYLKFWDFMEPRRRTFSVITVVLWNNLWYIRSPNFAYQ